MPISQLLEEIRNLEDTILYCENRILRKRIAIEEIFQGREVGIEQEETEVAVRQPNAAEAATEKLPTVPQMIRLVLPAMPPVFGYGHLKAAMFERWGAAETKIRTGVYVAVAEMLGKEIIRTPGGFEVAPVMTAPQTTMANGEVGH
jgi:hypothetical protein